MTVKPKATVSRKRDSYSVRDPSIRTVRKTLRGPVMDIFCQNVPALHGLTHLQAYNLILDNPELAYACFQVFRQYPDLFNHLLVGTNSRPVESDDQMLRCGRSMDEVVALVVRAVAKRHFRAHFKSRRIGRPSPSVFHRLMHQLSLLFADQSPPVRRRPTRADIFYQTMQSYLLYEWQLPLIPHYVSLPVPLIRSLGKHLLEIHTSQQLRDLINSAKEEIPVEKKISKNPTVSHSSTDSSQQQPDRIEVMWKHSQAAHLPELFRIDEDEMRGILFHITSVDQKVVMALNSSGMNPREVMVLLCSLDRRLGHSQLRNIFGTDVRPDLITSLKTYVKTLDLAEMHDPEKIRDASAQLLDRLRSSGYLFS